MITKQLNKICKVLVHTKLLPDTFTCKLLYYRKFKKWPNLNNPQDINEKMMWLLFNSDTSEWTNLADKYKVREFFKKKGCGELLVKLYGHYEDVDDIDFNSLPNKFVIKSNNGFGTVKIVKDKTLLDIPKTKIELKSWIAEPYGYLTGEMHYTKIRRCIVIEELLEQDPKLSSSLIDYKIWCMNGKAYSCMCCTNRNIKKHTTDYNYYELPNWTIRKDLIPEHYRNGSVVPKPKHLDEMITYAEKLAEDFPLVRVDLYESNDKVYFGEMTFTCNACHMSFFTDEELLRMGKAVNLSGLIKKTK